MYLAYHRDYVRRNPFNGRAEGAVYERCADKTVHVSVGFVPMLGQIYTTPDL